MFKFTNYILSLFTDVVDPDFHGFIWKEPSDTDWISGKETGIVYEPRNNSGDWTVSLPDPELQKFNFESFACVTFSGHHVLTTQLNWLYNNGMTDETKKFFNDNGYLINGKFNINEIFNIAQNGTTQQGNDMVSYWDNVRKVGFVPQSKWTKLEDCKVWSDMQKPIPQSVLNLGLEALKYVDITYEWVLTAHKSDPLIVDALKQSPLQIATPVCPSWGTGQVSTCPSRNLQHCTMIYKLDSGYRILDQYLPFLKRLSPDYYIPCAIKAVITDKGYIPPPPPPYVKYQFNNVMVYGDQSEDVRQLQILLKKMGYFQLEPTGYYGLITSQAVLQFQTANSVAFPSELIPLGGKRCGVKTLAKLNSITF